MTGLVDCGERRGRQEANRIPNFKHWANKEVPSKQEGNAPIYSKSAILVMCAIG